MKLVLSVMFLSIMNLLFAQSKKFEISGTVKSKAKASKVILSYTSGRIRVIDSVEVKKNKFYFSGPLHEVGKANLVLVHASSGDRFVLPDELQVYLSDTPIVLSVKDSIKHAVVKGSKMNAEYQRYIKFISPAENVLKEVNHKWNNFNKAERDEFWFERDQKSRAAYIEKKKLMAAYAEQNPTSYFSLMALNEMSVQNVDYALVAPIFKKLSPELQQLESGIRLKERIARAGNTVIGAIAPDFTQNDVNGKPVKLSDFRGKFVLIDFWASWCGPCRAENPNLVEAYNKFKDKNFTVLGVSLDNVGGKQAWLDAIEKDGLPWTQVSDLKGWDNEVAKLYSITGVPQAFLIDPNGKIVALNLRGEDLHKTLEKLL